MKFKKMLSMATLAILIMSFSTSIIFAKTLRFAEIGPNRGSRAIALIWFADEIQKRSNGSLEIEFHWGKSLLGTKSVLKGVGDGVADMGSVIGFFTPKKLRGYNIGDLPVDNSDVWVGMRAIYALSTSNPALKKEFKKNKVVYITNYSTGPIQLVSTKPISALSDLKGIKLRGSGPYGKTLSDFGANVQRMSQSKVYEALDSGLIECNQNYYYAIKAFKQYEVANYVLELDWGQNMAFGVFMNKNSYARLTDAEKSVIDGVGFDFIDYFAKLMIEEKEIDKAAMIAGIGGNSIKVTRLSENERSKLISSGDKYVNEWVSEATNQGVDGKGILADYLNHVSKFENEIKSKGTPWTR